MLPSVLRPLARLVSSRGDAFAPTELLLSPRDSLAVIAAKHQLVLLRARPSEAARQRLSAARAAPQVLRRERAKAHDKSTKMRGAAASSARCGPHSRRGRTTRPPDEADDGSVSIDGTTYKGEEPTGYRSSQQGIG